MPSWRISLPRSAPRSPDAQLVVMAKYPARGRVKTRLAATIGSARACALYRAFVLDLADRLAQLPYDVVWAYWPPRAPFGRLLPGARSRPQRGADLGARMANAIVAALRGGGPALVIGADAPHVSAASLARAAAALRGGADLVLGPAEDGGYYLIGVRAPVPALFRGIAWGTRTVLAVTRARARRLGLRTRLLPPTFDVDEAMDLRRLRVSIARGRVHLPRTAALLGRGNGY